MRLLETLLYWAGVFGYAVGFALMTISMVFKRNHYGKAITVTNIAFALHTASITIRWIQSGHPPFVTFFESVSAAAWFAILGYLILVNRSPSMKASGIGVLGGVFLLLGWASTPSISGEVLSPELKTIWLFIHATFATSAIGCYLVAFGTSIVWLKRNRQDKIDTHVDLPEERQLDEVSFRFISVGFLFYTIMVISGAIWANQSWGRYWGWDPIETWSLMTWLVYALYIHIHFTYKKLRGRFTTWYAIFALIVAAFSLWGISFLYNTIHLYG